LIMGYYETYQEQRERELQAHRDYWSLRVHWAPFLGPDKLGRTLKCGTAGGPSTTWTYRAPVEPKPWKHSTKPTASTTAHVEMSQRVFRDHNTGWEFTFWALAPKAHRLSAAEAAHTEWVWLILEGTNGRGVHKALVDQETDQVYWWDKIPAHYVAPAEELSNSA